MTASKYMSPVVQTVTPRNTLKDAAQILFEHDCGMVAVVDDDSKVKTVLTDRDVCIIACNHDRPLSELNVGEMTGDKLFSCGPDDALGDLLGKMAENRIRRLPVVDGDGNLQGVISLDDLARAAVAGEVEAATLAKTLAAVTGKG
jgi:CBS domain-containing protein